VKTGFPSRRQEGSHIVLRHDASAGVAVEEFIALL